VTVCLLGSGTFFTQTLQRSLSIDLGYQADRLLNVDFNLVDHAYTPVEVETFFGHLRESLSADPVVVQAAVTRSAGGMGPGGSLQYDGAPVDPGEFVRYLGVDREYFDAAGLRLLYGRNFTVDDRQEAQLVGIASESLARFLGAEGEADVLGHSLYIGSRGTVTIVGVAEDRVYSPRLPGAMDLHLPTAQVQYAVPSGRASLARGRVILDVNDAGQARRRVLARVRELDSDVVPVSMQTAEEELLSIFALQHLASRMTGVFGLVALALVTISLHSLVLSIVTARRKEIAIRTALGATGRNVLAWFGREIARPLGVGILFGMAGVWMAYRGMTAYIVGLAADDLSAVVAVITAACLLAAGTSLGAALWATREPPYSVLREN
jgi:hypothetical protein